jgi:ElaB/YqjD/DUF883 family membrane-anchored ribosome-binding protein
MINQISNNSNNVLEEINNKFSHITTALINTQTDAINNLEKNTQHNQNHIDVIQNKLAETMNHFEKYINNNVTTTQQLNNAVANILTKYEESIKANQEQLQQTNETLSNITKSMVEFNNIASTMNKSASAIGSSANILKDTNTTIKQQNELFSQGVDTLQYSLQSKIDNWNDYINRTGETEAKINDLVKLLNETISAYTIKHADINTNFMKQFSEQIQKIANSTNSAIESIEEFTERCGDLLNKR